MKTDSRRRLYPYSRSRTSFKRTPTSSMWDVGGFLVAVNVCQHAMSNGQCQQQQSLPLVVVTLPLDASTQC